MSRRLPSLVAIRAFEAAARLSSFTRAAQEIGTTQPGVSRLIRVLEDQVGQVLFVRFNRRVELTPAGRRLAQSLTEAFDSILGAFSDLDVSHARILTVVASSGFNPGWLIPLIARFEEAHPDTTVRLSWSSSFGNLSDADYDVAMRVGSGKWGGVIARKMCDKFVTPLCSPDFISRYGPLESVKDLMDCPLVERNSVQWKRWLEAARQSRYSESLGPSLRLVTCNLHGEAALLSQGVALLMPMFYKEELVDGRLVQPLPTILNESPNAYWFTYPEVRRRSQSIHRFIDWMTVNMDISRVRVSVPRSGARAVHPD